MMLSQVRNSLLEKSLGNCMNHRSGYRHVLTRTGPRVGTERMSNRWLGQRSHARPQAWPP